MQVQRHTTTQGRVIVDARPTAWETREGFLSGIVFLYADGTRETRASGRTGLTRDAGGRLRPQSFPYLSHRDALNAARRQVRNTLALSPTEGRAARLKVRQDRARKLRRMARHIAYGLRGIRSARIQFHALHSHTDKGECFGPY